MFLTISYGLILILQTNGYLFNLVALALGGDLGLLILRAFILLTD